MFPLSSWQFLVPQQTGNASSVDEVSGMAVQRGTLHQPVFPVPPVQGEGLPHQNGCGSPSEADTDPLIDTRHVEDDKQHEKGEQPSGEDEQVLAFESLKLYRATDSLVDGIGLHRLRGRNYEEWWLPQ